jgi:hypothetical protein
MKWLKHLFGKAASINPVRRHRHARFSPGMELLEERCLLSAKSFGLPLLNHPAPTAPGVTASASSPSDTPALQELTAGYQYGVYDYLYCTHSMDGLFAYVYGYWGQYFANQAAASQDATAWHDAYVYGYLASVHAYQDFTATGNIFAEYAYILDHAGSNDAANACAYYQQNQNQSDWFSQNLPDSALQSLARTDFTRDNSITYSDMLGLLNQAAGEGTVSGATMQSLQALIANAGQLNMPGYVTDLANDVVNGNQDNANYQCLDSQGNEITYTLGDLSVGSSSTQLTALVNKWFLGVNEPASATAYSAVSGNLFGPNGPVFTDVNQGGVGDCWLLSSLAEAAARQPGLLNNMFIYDGTNVINGQTVGVWTVGFFTSGSAHYVTVDGELPSGGGYYDHPANGVMWVALAEKAYAEANGAGLVTTGNLNSNSYAALDNGWPSWALTAITGQTASDYALDPAGAVTAYQAGDLVVLATGSNPASPYIVPHHAYALIAYNSSWNLPFEVYNPWGTDSSGWALGTYNGQQVWGLFYVDAAFLSQNFTTHSFASAAPASGMDPLSLASASQSLPGEVELLS